MDAAEQEFKCGICWGLLYEPVVGQCGHDFCRDCLVDWASRLTHTALQRGRIAHRAAPCPITCPTCRQTIAPSVDAIANLGVCIRLKNTINLLFPEESKEQEQERKAAKTALASSPASQGTVTTANHTPSTLFLGMTPSSPMWSPPGVPSFTMGWCEAPTRLSRREARRKQRGRHSSSSAQRRRPAAVMVH